MSVTQQAVHTLTLKYSFLTMRSAFLLLVLLRNAWRPESGAAAQYAACQCIRTTLHVSLHTQPSRLHYYSDHTVHTQHCSLQPHPALTTLVSQHNCARFACSLPFGLQAAARGVL